MASMELNDFNHCNQMQKTALVWKYGEFIADQVSGNYTVCLYHVDTFFAELWYRVADNEIQSVREFKNDNCLEPYLNMVDLSDIII